MRRFAIVVVFQWFAVAAFCQTATAAGPSLSNKPVAPQLRFSFGDPFATNSAPADSAGDHACDGRNAAQNQINTYADADRVFHVPCVDARKLVEMASNSPSVSPLLAGRQPGAKGEPIPTQWPGAKFEQIPTTWPKLKVQKISGHDPGAVSIQVLTSED